MLDLIIVGAGPAGLAVAIEAQKYGLTYLVIDKGGIVDTIRKYPIYSTFFSTSDRLELDDVPFPSLNKQPTRVEALNYYSRLAVKRKLSFMLHTKVKLITKIEQDFEVQLDNKPSIKSHKLIIATGYYDCPNLLGIKGENLPHVSHYYTEPYKYIAQNVLVVGGSNSATEATLDLWRHGAFPTLVHKNNQLYEKLKYWVKPDIENRIKEGSIEALFNTELLAIENDSVTLKTGSDLHERKFNHVLLLTGYHPDTSLLVNAGVEINQESLIPNFDSETFETNISGLYVAGTLSAGRNTSKIFIENSRHHGKTIIQHILNH